MLSLLVLSEEKKNNSIDCQSSFRKYQNNLQICVFLFKMPNKSYWFQNKSNIVSFIDFSSKVRNVPMCAVHPITIVKSNWWFITFFFLKKKEAKRTSDANLPVFNLCLPSSVTLCLVIKRTPLCYVHFTTNFQIKLYAFWQNAYTNAVTGYHWCNQ